MGPFQFNPQPEHPTVNLRGMSGCNECKALGLVVKSGEKCTFMEASLKYTAALKL